MTYREFIDIWEELRNLGYPVGDGTKIELSRDLCTCKQTVIFIFEDSGFKITVMKEINHDNDN